MSDPTSDTPRTEHDDDTLRAEHDDDVQRKMRAALLRKKADQHESHPGGIRNKGVAEAHNDKSVREFRRKDGS